MKNLPERCFELYGLSSQLCVRAKPQVILIVMQSRKKMHHPGCAHDFKTKDLIGYL